MYGFHVTNIYILILLYTLSFIITSHAPAEGHSIGSYTKSLTEITQTESHSISLFNKQIRVHSKHIGSCIV